jgi:hypothetical protein
VTEHQRQARIRDLDREIARADRRIGSIDRSLADIDLFMWATYATLGLLLAGGVLVVVLVLLFGAT